VHNHVPAIAWLPRVRPVGDWLSESDSTSQPSQCSFGRLTNISGPPMTKQHRADHLLRRLNELYPETPIPLDHRDAYTLLVAVLLSAQCTDVRVNQVTPALFDLADNPRGMMRVAVDEIYAVIRPCGLAPRKSAAISELSRILVEQHGGQVPADFAALEALPGVGHKTASVVMAQAFGVPAFPVDTHIHRLATRWKLGTGKNVEHTERSLKKLFPRASWNRLHLQIIFYGREHCTARGCDGTRCLLCRELFAKA
jgi:endonuclease-3